MYKIWYRNPLKSVVIGRCGGDEKKRMTMQNRQKSNAKKKCPQTYALKISNIQTPVSIRALASVQLYCSLLV